MKVSKPFDNVCIWYVVFTQGFYPCLVLFLCWLPNLVPEWGCWVFFPLSHPISHSCEVRTIIGSSKCSILIGQTKPCYFSCPAVFILPPGQMWHPYLCIGFILYSSADSFPFSPSWLPCHWQILCVILAVCAVGLLNLIWFGSWPLAWSVIFISGDILLSYLSSVAYRHWSWLRSNFDLDFSNSDYEAYSVK